MLEVCRIVEVLFAPLNLSLHAPASLTPFPQVGSRFFITSLVGQHLVLVLPPDLFQLLLLKVVGWVVPEVIGASLELVDTRVLDFLFAIGVERFEGRFESGPLGLGKLVVDLGESDRASCFCRSAHHVGLAVIDVNGYVID